MGVIELFLLADLGQQTHHADDDTGDDENTEIAGAHDGQCFHKQIYTHDFYLPLKQDQWQP